MNTVTLSAGEPLHSGAGAPMPGPVLLALSKLRPSSRNVRKTASGSIPELAESIARVGLLQNLTVLACGEHYEVVAGQRRLAALKLLAKRKRLPKAYEVPCLLVSAEAAGVVSLTENVQREAMHPADQFEAFAALVAQGRPIEDIAADFGVTPSVVHRRLKLANVSPRLRADYRADAVTLDQLMALAITDDHAAQEAAFYDVPQWQRSPQGLREHLTRDEIDANRDPLARFVGVAAYEAAGGGVRRDLFSDDVRMTDPDLLERLGLEKLAPVADTIRAEGWAWVETAPRAMYSDLHQFERARRSRREATDAEAERIQQIDARQKAIEDTLEDEDAELSEEERQALDEEADRLSAQIDAINESLLVFAPEVLALAGVIVSVTPNGETAIYRGLLREADAKALRTHERTSAGLNGEDESGSEGLATRSISEKLARGLSAHRTAALQVEVARKPHVALVAVVHQLALRVMCDSYYCRGAEVVNISVWPQDRFSTDAPDVAESAAALTFQAMRQEWTARLNQDPDALFAELLALQQEELLSLLAVCVASTVSAVTSREDASLAAALAQAVALDMRQWWTPTAEAYFAHVSKAKILEAVQTFAPDEVARLSKLKKQDLANEAERLAVGTGWLPMMLMPPPSR